MRAIILAAGRGTRLHPYTQDGPKCLVELGGISLIERQIATLKGAGINDIVVVTGYRSDLLQISGTRTVHNDAWDSTNMVESLFAAEDDFGDDLIVAYADIVYEPRVIDALLDSPHDISVVVDTDWRRYWEHRFADPLSDAESLSMDDAGRITDIGDPVSDIATVQAQYIGLMRFRDDGVRALRRARNELGAVQRAWMEKRSIEKAYMTDLLMEMIQRGDAVFAVQVGGGWMEFDTVSDYESALSMIEDGSITQFFDPNTIRVST